MKEDNRTKQERFYDEAHRTYVVGSGQVLVEGFQRAPILSTLVFAFAGLLKLSVKVVEWFKRRKPPQEGPQNPEEEMSVFERCVLGAIDESGLKDAQKAKLREKVANSKNSFTENPWFSPPGDSFDGILNVEDLRLVHKIITKDGPYSDIRSTLRWLLSLDETELNAKIDELEGLIFTQENRGRFSTRSGFKAAMRAIDKAEKESKK